jgi:hypothetical protein
MVYFVFFSIRFLTFSIITGMAGDISEGMRLGDLFEEMDSILGPGGSNMDISDEEADLQLRDKFKSYLEKKRAGPASSNPPPSNNGCGTYLMNV